QSEAVPERTEKREQHVAPFAELKSQVFEVPDAREIVNLDELLGRIGRAGDPAAAHLIGVLTVPAKSNRLEGADPVEPAKRLRRPLDDTSGGRSLRVSVMCAPG